MLPSSDFIARGCAPPSRSTLAVMLCYHIIQSVQAEDQNLQDGISAVQSRLINPAISAFGSFPTFVPSSRGNLRTGSSNNSPQSMYSEKPSRRRSLADKTTGKFSASLVLFVRPMDQSRLFHPRLFRATSCQSFQALNCSVSTVTAETNRDSW